ncbi:hypothetical protein EVAR_78660_1 [Eumeta japonica]|uniref:Uncharacterized protein n=1 Tax=Eumeta variegata TaxID=151549 RepID=A0A4C1U7U2_EUMVA|nr:hypothetical protein EVAR_78660_1 [Eumeta japonica]
MLANTRAVKKMKAVCRSISYHFLQPLAHSEIALSPVLRLPSGRASPYRRTTTEIKHVNLFTPYASPMRFECCVHNVQKHFGARWPTPPRAPPSSNYPRRGYPAPSIDDSEKPERSADRVCPPPDASRQARVNPAEGTWLPAGGRVRKRLFTSVLVYIGRRLTRPLQLQAR